jgi:hypothetical protein
MEMEIRGEALLAWMHRASPRVSLLAIIDRELLNLFVQLTVSVLSHHDDDVTETLKSLLIARLTPRCNMNVFEVDKVFQYQEME